MRITLLSCAVLALTMTTAAAQATQVGPWQPRPTIGVGLGGFGSLFCTERGGNVIDAKAKLAEGKKAVECFRPIRSVTVEIPLSDTGRIRIEGGRSTMPIVPRGEWEASAQKDTAHIGRLMISAVVVGQPDELLSPYVGIGVALQRTGSTSHHSLEPAPSFISTSAPTCGHWIGSPWAPSSRLAGPGRIPGFRILSSPERW